MPFGFPSESAFGFAGILTHLLKQKHFRTQMATL
jgi:hypothetical protein